ncbi:c-type cytochrome [Rheinheimera sp.]|uniref:c-type cytochrome n=1 Tax=Rheinheimera sp. TaxID=1869214 RepID=UPI00307DFAFC
MRHLIRFCVLLCCFDVFSADLTVSLPGKQVEFSLAELKQQLPLKRVQLYDPVYEQQKSYQGFLLTDVLTLAGYQSAMQGDELKLVASDGYAPAMPLSLVAGEPVLAFAETGKADFEFAAVTQGKAKLSPAPFYLVWTQGAAAKHNPWPYQLVKIELVSFADTYAALYPTGVPQNSAVYQGFLLFKSQCLSCHSINLQGGEVGPELNAPKNVTEYWSEANLRAFIKNSNSFRYKSKMPPFSHLKEQQIDQLLAFLRHSKERKLRL